MLLAGVSALPGWSHAAVAEDLWSAETVAAYRLEAELAQLRTVRERLGRRQALHAALEARARNLSREIAGLGRRAEQARAQLADHRDVLRDLERELDRIMPRLLARTAAMEQRRGQAARALADLAGLSRRNELDPALRARMRAIGPVLLAVLRNRDAVSEALSLQRDRAYERRDRIAARVPLLGPEIEALRGRREAKLAERQSTLEQLAGLAPELRRLSETSAALARRMVVLETAHRARAEPDAARPAQDRRTAALDGAVVRGRADRPYAVAAIVPTAMARAAAIAPRSRLEVPPLEPAQALRQPLPEAARVAARHDRLPGSGRARGAGGSNDVAAPLDRPDANAISVAGLSSRVDPARLPPPAPIRPSLEMASARRGGGEHAVGMTIAAAPGQGVAAPDDGRIVFADDFKSYGLLLIIEHDSEYHTLLWGFSKLRVDVGDKVRGGEIIGVMDVVDGIEPRLGVELRRRGRPVNPLPWLAGSSSKVRG